MPSRFAGAPDRTTTPKPRCTASISDTIDAANGDAVSLAYEPGTTDGANYQDQLVTEIANGTAPDVFWIPGTDIARFQSAGLILDLAPLAAESGFDTSEFYPEPMYHLTFDPEAGAPGDKLWGLPRDVSTFALYLNNDLIAEAGADDPRALAAAGEWNWDSLCRGGGCGQRPRWREQGLRDGRLVGAVRLLHQRRRWQLLQRGRHRMRRSTRLRAVAGVEQMKAVFEGGLAVSPTAKAARPRGRPARSACS